MMFAGIGLHVLVAIFFAIHAVKTGQNTYWLFILLAFPGLGSMVYLFAIYLPQSRLERGARRAVRSVVKAIDPGRELREAEAAFETTPTVQNQMRLAQALLALGRAEEAASCFDQCLRGPFATDSEVRFGAARAFLACGRAADALKCLHDLQQGHPDYRAEAVALLEGKAHAQLGQPQAAWQVLEAAAVRYGSFESKAALASWAYAAGDVARAETLYTELEKSWRRWNRTSRELNAPAWAELQQAREAATQVAR